jgi:hypothetical protein
VQADQISTDFSDGRLYESIAKGIRRGDGYYETASRELTGRGYAVGSIFNWRLPVYAWLFGAPYGFEVANALLLAILAVSAWMAVTMTGDRASWIERAAAGLGLIGAYGWLSHPYPAYFTELWSGLLIFLSASAFSARQNVLGIMACAAALSFRELALPYVAIVGLMALVRRRLWRLAATGLAGGIFFAAFALHYWCVRNSSCGPVSTEYTEWLAWGGTPFVISTCRMNYLLALLVPECAAVYFPLAIFGLIGSRSPASMPLVTTAAVYVAAFAVVGTPSNYYWGWMIVPPLWVGFVLAPRSLVDLLRAVGRRTNPEHARAEGLTREVS